MTKRQIDVLRVVAAVYLTLEIVRQLQRLNFARWIEVNYPGDEAVVAAARARDAGFDVEGPVAGELWINPQWPMRHYATKSVRP